MAERGHNSNTSLTELLVDPGIGESCDGVASKRSQEDKGYNGVAEVVVGFKLFINKNGC